MQSARKTEDASNTFPGIALYGADIVELGEIGWGHVHEHQRSGGEPQDAVDKVHFAGRLRRFLPGFIGLDLSVFFTRPLRRQQKSEISCFSTTLMSANVWTI